LRNHALSTGLFLLFLVGDPTTPLSIAPAAAQEHAAPAATQAAPSAPPAPSPPAQKLSLSDAAQLARTRGFDVIIAETQVRGAEADIRAASALPNPVVTPNVGWTLSCGGPCESGSPWGWGIGVADQGLVEGAISRKRALRRAVAEQALTAAKFGRNDAIRILVTQTKIQYVTTAAAAVKLDFTREVAASLEKSVEVNRVRYPRVIDEGQLFRVEQEAMKAEQEVERAGRDLRQQQINLAFLIGATGPLPALEVDKDSLKYRTPELPSLNTDNLMRIALENRPDRRQAAAREAQSEAQIALAKRQVFPDISLTANYQEQGTLSYNSQLPTLTVGASLPIPLLYRQEGEIRRAEADRDTAGMTRRKIEATLSAEIESAHTAFTTARAIVERYEGSLLDRARRARDITQVQYTAGSATLTDLLDAQRSFVQVNVDYQAELINYWTAIFQLEQAVGKEFVP
jgi:cobalt-zinc-cadmium efflux system outer membrane protein